MSGLKLWEVGDKLDEITRLIMEADGEIDAAIEARLDELEGAFEAKVERIALKIRELKVNGLAAKAEADRLNGMSKAFTNAAKRLQHYLYFEMQRLNRTSVATNLCKVNVVPNSRPSIKWDGDPKKAPMAFQKFKVEIDGNYAYEQWKEGRLPEGFIVEEGSHVRIS